LYRRKDAILVLFCDDFRIGASDPVLKELYSSFYDKFGITTAPGDCFLGMDTCYQRERGVLKLSMESYIATTMERFRDFDTRRGYPFGGGGLPFVDHVLCDGAEIAPGEGFNTQGK
jgi:hypothetical protein